MKVILTEDVKSLGKKGDIVEVNDGYARNFILKTKKGIEANAKNMNDLKLKKQKLLPNASARKKNRITIRLQLNSLKQQKNLQRNLAKVR